MNNQSLPWPRYKIKTKLRRKEEKWQLLTIFWVKEACLVIQKPLQQKKTLPLPKHASIFRVPNVFPKSFETGPT